MVDTNTYTYLEPVNGSGPTIDTSDTGKYLSNVYDFALTITVALALIMVTIAGIRYTISWASPGEKNAAKSQIWSAIGGLVLALLSYILLNTVNPELLKTKVEAPRAAPAE